MNKIATGMLCALVFVLTACGGSSDEKPNTNTSSSAPSSVASSSAVSEASSSVSSIEESSSSEALSSDSSSSESEMASSSSTSDSSSSADESSESSSSVQGGGVSSLAESSASSSVESSAASSESSEQESSSSESSAASSESSEQESSSSESSAASSESSAMESSSSESSAVSSESSAIESSSGESSESSSVATSSSSVVASSSSSVVSSVAAQVGVFVDSAVAGIHYETTPGGFSGVTSATGQYLYAEGDTVVFSIGAISFPSVVAKGVVTPLDMGTDATDPVVINIAVLLQSLDADGDASNGITIPAAAAEAADASVSFDLPYDSFVSLVLPVVQHSDANKNVVTETAAIAHLEESVANVKAKSLIGTWYTTGPSDIGIYNYALFILDEHNYVALDHDSGETRLERGTYSWDQATGVVTVTPEVGDPRNLDLYPPMANGNTLAVNGNTLLATDASETFELVRLLPSSENPLIGGWSLVDQDVFFAFSDSHYVMGQFSGDTPSGQPGVEMGSYSYDLETKALTYATQADANGEWGLSHPCGVLNADGSNNFNCGPGDAPILQTMEVTGDMLTFISEADTIANGGEEEPVRLERVVDGIPDGDIHLKLQLTLTLTEYVPGVRYEVEGGTMQCDNPDAPGHNPSEYVPGYTEEYGESWLLGGNEARPTWVATIPAVYDTVAKVVTFDLHEPLHAIPGHPGFYSETWENLEVSYSDGEVNVITGTYTDIKNLTWDRDDSVSTCTSTYSVTGQLR